MAKINFGALARPVSETKIFRATGMAGEMVLSLRRLLQVEQIALFGYADELAGRLAVAPVMLKDDVVHAPPTVCQIAVGVDMSQVANEGERYTVEELIQAMVDTPYLHMLQEAFLWLNRGDEAGPQDGVAKDPLRRKRSPRKSSAVG